MSIGWVKIHRSIKDWQWYGDVNCRLLMFELIITVNHSDSFYKGTAVLRGQRIFGVSALSAEIGISIQQLRSSLRYLKSTNEITTQSTNRFTLLTLVNYEYFQGSEVDDNKRNNTPNNKPITNQQQTNNKPITTSKECKKKKNERTVQEIGGINAILEPQAAPTLSQNNNLPDSIETPKPKKTLARFTPPTLEEVTQYFLDKGDPNYQDEAQGFIDFYESNGWKVGKNNMKKWKSSVGGWIRRSKQRNSNGTGQQFTKRLSVPERVEQAIARETAKDNAKQTFNESIVGENEQGMGPQVGVGVRGDPVNGMGGSAAGDEWPEDEPWVQ